MTQPTPRGRLVTRIPWLGLPLAVLIVFGAHVPSVAQRVPRLFFPAVAVVGAVLLVIAFVRSLFQSLRRYRAERRLRPLPLFVNALATILLVVLPLTRLLGVMAAPSSGAPLILTRFGEWRGAEGYPRLDPHRGIDVAGSIGADVLAAADGRIAVARDNGGLCGLIVVIAHDPHGYRTVYCHLSMISVKSGDEVRRGQRIGTIGTTGQRAFPGYEHVHLELQRGRDSRDIEDPGPRIVGCFDGTKQYPADRLVLTYPVKC